MTNTIKLKYALVAAVLAATGASAFAADPSLPLRNCEVWKDTEGNMINAHGGGILYHDGVYYWYGEYKKGHTILPEWATWECYRTDVTGVGCYSSPDMVTWNFEGIVLPGSPDPESDLHFSKVLERPKVVYNKKTGKFVMWAHVESADYSKACAGVAVSDSPTGPFEYIGSFRPNGAMSRDQTVFVDDDGTAYQFSSSEENQTLHINRLTDDYLKPDGKFTRNFIGMAREAPAVFKHNGKYYMLSSGCTGWDPNQAELAVADSIMGEWKTLPYNPCTGPDADKTFYGQSTYVQPIQGKDNAYIAMFDRWNKTDLENSRYIWLSLEFGDNGEITIPWRESWVSGSASAACHGNKNRKGGYAGYLFAYFTGNSADEEAVRFGLSRDGVNWHALNGNRPVIDSKAISETGGVRDPHICRGADGRFYMTLTDMVSAKGWDSNRGLVLLSSDNLVDWHHSAINIKRRFKGNKSLKRVWAPETILDPKTGKMMVYWSMKHGKKGKDIIYYAYANTDFTDFETEPKPLFIPSDKGSCIDGNIIEKDGKFHLIYKTEGNGNTLKMVVADDLTSGKWEELPGTLQATTDAVEGGGIFKLAGEDRYILAYDVYNNGRYEFCESTDLRNFKLMQPGFQADFHPRHGSIIPVTEDEYALLESKWNQTATQN